MSFDVGRAIARLERAEHLHDAEESAAWVIRRSKLKRIKSASEREPTVHCACTCLHGTSYTLACKKCRRTKLDAQNNLAKLKAKLSIT